jgi:hypothetical protein
MGMTAKQISTLKKLANQAEKAAQKAERNLFLIETILSADEANRGKVRSHSSAKQLFRKLAI